MAFVGRDRELGALTACLDASVGGHGQLAVISGPPGSGKTRLASALTAMAESRRAGVGWGRCRPGAPPYSPWSQLLRGLGLPATGLGGDPFALADVVCQRFAAAGRPVVAVLDDLDHADAPSMALVGALAPLLPTVAALVVATCREPRAGASNDGLAALPKDTVRLPLRGLGDADVAALVASLSGGQCPPSLAAHVRAQTGGNPWLVVETARLLSGEDRPADGTRLEEPAWSDDLDLDRRLPLPPSLREMVAAGTRRLSADGREVLAVAATAGPAPPLAVLEAATGFPRTRLLAAIEEASAHDLLEAGDTAACAFRSPMARRAVYEAIPARERSLRHHQVGEALERLAGHPGGHRPPASVLASHLLRGAVASGDARKAVAYARVAGDEANAARRHPAAAGYYAAGLDLIAPDEHNAGERCELLLRLGDVQSKMGQLARARETFEEAVRFTRDHGTAEQFARAVLGVGGRLVRLDAFFDRDLVGLLEEALDRVGPGDSGRRATLLARLSRALFCGPDDGRRAALCTEALDMARRVGDPEAEIAALHSRYWVLSRPEELPERLAVASELLLLAEDVGDPEMALQGHHWRLMQLAEVGDMPSVAADVGSYTRLANLLRQPLYVWFSHLLEGMLALSEGRFTDAEQHAREALRVGRENRNPFAQRYFDAQLFWIRWQQWRVDELPDDEEDRIFTRTTMARVKRAFRCALAGQRLAAKADFDAVAEHAFADLPYDATWMALMTMLAETCSYLGDAERADQLYAALLPYAGRNIVIGAALACNGAVSHYLGVLAALSGRYDLAADHFEHALDFNRDIGVRACAGRTAYEYAAMLRRRGAPGDGAKAARLLADAADDARALGLRALGEKVAALAGPAVAAGEPEPSPSPAAMICRNGDYWTIVYESSTIVLKHCKGLVYLQHLLRNPNREFHVADLAMLTSAGPGAPGAETAWPPGNGELDALGALGGDGGGYALDRWPQVDDPLDQEARRRYRQRLLDLEDELGEARRFNDPERAAKAQREMDFLVAELAARYRGRAAGPNWASASEKTRKAVTNRIRAVIQRLTKEQLSLGTHLSRTIHTGTFCAYIQEDPHRWTPGVPARELAGG